jgi:hypothetical protein
MNRYPINKEIRRLPIQKRILVIEKAINPIRREEEKQRLPRLLMYYIEITRQTKN